MPDTLNIKDFSDDELRQLSPEELQFLHDQELKNEAAASANSALGYGKAALTGAAKAVPDMLGMAASGAVTLGQLDSPQAAAYGAHAPPPSWLPNWLTARSQAKADEYAATHKPKDFPTPPNPAGITNKIGKAIGGWYQPQSFGERLTQAGAEGAVGGALGGSGPGGMLAGTTLYGALPGVAGQAAGEATQGLTFPEWLPLVGGKDISPYASAAASIISPNVVRKAITPNTLTDPARLAANRVIERELGPRAQTAGQFLGDTNQMKRELAADPSINTRQQQQVMQRVTEPAAPGRSTTDVTPEWLHDNLTSPTSPVKRTYDNLESTTHIDPVIRGTGTVNPQIYNDLVNIAWARPQDVNSILKMFRQVNTRLVPSRTSLPQERLHSALFGGSGTRRLSGQDYRRLRSNLYSAAENAPTNEAAHSYRQTAAALDNAMQATNPAWGQAWQANNRQYANLLMLEKASRTASAGVERFTPQQLKSAGQQTMGPRDFAGSESGRFINAAGKSMPPLPSEPIGNSLGNIGKGSLLGMIGGAGIGAAQHLMGHPAVDPYVAGIFGGEMGAGLGAYLGHKANYGFLPQMNPAVQAWKKNQLLPAGEGPARRQQMIVRALLAASRGVQ